MTMEVAERRAKVLRAIVEDYIETAQPVGSQAIASSRRLAVSSATVRNDMNQLERDGYIIQPHTSAGRIPTDLGYRYFVDHFTRAALLPPTHRRAVARFFAGAHRALEDLFHETSQLLARLTDHAAMIVGPQAEAATIRSAQLVPLQPGSVLAVAVLSNGAVEKEHLPVETDVDDARVELASAALARTLDRRTFGARPTATPTGDETVDSLVRRAVDALNQRVSTAEPLYVGGASRIAADQDAFATAERAALLLEMLEEQVVVVSLVRRLLEDRPTVSIGSENALDELRDCSLVLAPYSVEGQVAGTVGVLGPTRMDYQQALAAVAAVSEQLGRLLS